MAIKSAWDYSHLGPLSARERRRAAAHERLHLEFARARGHMTVLEYEEAAARIRGFERGDEVVDEARAANVVLASDGFNAATDSTFNRVLAEAGIKAPSR